MSIGIIADLAIGAHPGGAGHVGGPGVLRAGIQPSGAPPDAFNQRGQDWGLPPMHPRAAPRGRRVPARLAELIDRQPLP